MRQETEEGKEEGKLTWVRSCEGGQCMEVAAAGDAVLMRCTPGRDIVLTLTRDEWRDFLAGAKAGAFDGL